MATNVIFNNGGGISTQLPAATGSSGDPYYNGLVKGVFITDSDGTDATILTDFTAIIEHTVEGVDANGNSAVAFSDRLFYDAAADIKINKDSVNGKYYGLALAAVNSGASKVIRVGFGGSAGIGMIAPVSLLSADGAIAVPSYSTEYAITKGSVAALTLVAPTSGVHDGVVLDIVSTTAFAHTITQATPGFNGAGAGSTIATFGAAVGNGIRLMALAGVWYILDKTGITLS